MKFSIALTLLLAALVSCSQYPKGSHVPLEYFYEPGDNLARVTEIKDKPVDWFLELFDKLQDGGKDLNASIEPTTSDTFLHLAIRSGSTKMAQALIRSGVDVFLANKAGKTALNLIQELPCSREMKNIFSIYTGIILHSSDSDDDEVQVVRYRRVEEGNGGVGGSAVPIQNNGAAANPAARRPRATRQVPAVQARTTNPRNGTRGPRQYVDVAYSWPLQQTMPVAPGQPVRNLNPPNITFPPAQQNLNAAPAATNRPSNQLAPRPIPPNLTIQQPRQSPVYPPVTAFPHQTQQQHQQPQPQYGFYSSLQHPPNYNQFSSNIYNSNYNHGSNSNTIPNHYYNYSSQPVQNPQTQYYSSVPPPPQHIQRIVSHPPQNHGQIPAPAPAQRSISQPQNYSQNVAYAAPQTQNVAYAAPQTQNVAYAAPQTQNLAYAAPQTQNNAYAAPQTQNVAYAALPILNSTLAQPVQIQTVAYAIPRAPQMQNGAYAAPQMQQNLAYSAPVAPPRPQTQPVAYPMTQPVAPPMIQPVAPPMAQPVVSPMPQAQVQQTNVPAPTIPNPSAAPSVVPPATTSAAAADPAIVHPTVESVSDLLTDPTIYSPKHSVLNSSEHIDPDFILDLLNDGDGKIDNNPSSAAISSTTTSSPPVLPFYQFKFLNYLPAAPQKNSENFESFLVL